MADVIRNAVIRIGLEQIPTELKAPDITPITAVQETIQQGEVKVQESVKETSAVMTAEESVRERIRSKISASIDKFVAEFQEGKRKEQEAQDKAAAEAERAAARIEAANVRAAKSLLQAGAAAFQFARGLAFVALSGSDDLQKVLATLALFQGGFDIIKGGVDVVHHLSNAFKATAAAGGLAAVAQAFYTKATVAATTATLALTAAMLANPVTAILVAIGAAVAIGVALWRSWGDEGEKANKRIEESMSAVTKAAQRFRLESQQQVQVLREQLAAAQRLAGIGETGRALEALRSGSSEGRLSDADAKSGGALNASRNASLIDDEKMREEIKKSSLATARDAAAQVEIERDRQTEILRLIRAEADQKDRALDKQKQLIESRQRELQVAQDLLETEKKRVQSIEAQLGATTKAEQAELRRLADKVAGGEQLTARQAERLGQLGGDLTKDIAQQQLANLGKDFADELAAKLGIDLRGRQGELQEDANRKESALNELTGGDTKGALERIAKEREKLAQETEAALAKQIEYLDQIEKVYQRVLERLAEIERATL